MLLLFGLTYYVIGETVFFFYEKCYFLKKNFLIKLYYLKTFAYESLIKVYKLIPIILKIWKYLVYIRNKIRYVVEGDNTEMIPSYFLFFIKTHVFTYCTDIYVFRL